MNRVRVLIEFMGAKFADVAAADALVLAVWHVYAIWKKRLQLEKWQFITKHQKY